MRRIEVGRQVVRLKLIQTHARCFCRTTPAGCSRLLSGALRSGACSIGFIYARSAFRRFNSRIVSSKDSKIRMGFCFAFSGYGALHLAGNSGANERRTDGCWTEGDHLRSRFYLPPTPHTSPILIKYTTTSIYTGTSRIFEEGWRYFAETGREEGYVCRCR